MILCGIVTTTCKVRIAHCRMIAISILSSTRRGVAKCRTVWRQFATTRGRVRSSAKLECSVGPVCLDTLRVADSAANMTLRPVGNVASCSEPALSRLLDTDKSGQLSRARDRFSYFCKKLRRTISKLYIFKKLSQDSSCITPFHTYCLIQTCIPISMF